MSTVGAAGLAGGVLIRDRHCLFKFGSPRCPGTVQHDWEKTLSLSQVGVTSQTHRAALCYDMTKSTVPSQLTFGGSKMSCQLLIRLSLDNRPEKCASKHKYIFSPFLHVLRNVLWPSLGFWGQRLQRQTRGVEWRIREGWERHFITSREELGGAPCFIEKPQQKNIICGCFG